AGAGVGTQGGDIGSGDNGEVQILIEVMRDTVGAVDPCGTHLASLSLLLSVHEVIYPARAIGLCEQFAQANGAHRSVSSVEIAGALFELIILDGSARRKVATQVGDAFALAH